ncbi:DNA polymerase III subunit epsilon [Aquabacterium sp. OR-4]|uniref:DNA polymerase III subunit epsilon n=1 Tax=Aquabacterium sp. OR-4 TaxID=2978127 RepID=UPI0021B2B6A4|nr:DNA polymerase III subunit epsilon [Aquabacterium sp. OR-4]MDT7836756.1 DNA polymerase III subunit epsilon [Aquabacterium sp. OR-4]
MRQIFLDTETTGLEANNGDRLVEIGCIEMENRRLTGNTLHLYINPERKGHEDAIRVHGLTDAFLADKPKFAEVAQQVVDFIGGAELIIHNAAFDVGFLDAEFARCKLGKTAQMAGKVTDTLLMAREMFPGKANSLDALCRRLEVDNAHRTFHGALLDAGLLAEVYIRLTRGQDSLVIQHDEGAPGSAAASAAAVDFSQFTLTVLEPTDEERAAHEALLADLDKASGGKTLWRTVLTQAPGLVAQ